MSSNNPNLISSDVLSSMRQREDMRKTHFDIFGLTSCDPSTSSLVVDQNLQITITWFLLIRFETEDSAGKLLIERIHGEKPILIF